MENIDCFPDHSLTKSKEKSHNPTIRNKVFSHHKTSEPDDEQAAFTNHYPKMGNTKLILLSKNLSKTARK